MKEKFNFDIINLPPEVLNHMGEKILREIIGANNKLILKVGNGSAIFDQTSGRGFGVSINGEFDGFREFYEQPNKKEKKCFQIIIGSPIDYEELVAYIIIEDKYIGMLTQEEGENKLKIEFFEELKVKEVDFYIFMEALQVAKEGLLGK